MTLFISDVKCYLGQMITKPNRPRLTREESQAQTRARLLDAARQEVARHGAGASVRDIADAAGYTQGAVYAHFETKDLLLLELLREHMKAEMKALELLVAKGDRQTGGLRTALDKWLDAMNSDEDWAMLAVELQMQARRDGTFANHYDTLFADHLAAMGTLVERLSAEVGAVLPAPAREVAATLMALAHGMAIQRRPTRHGTPDPSGAMIKLVLNCMLGTPVR